MESLKLKIAAYRKCELNVKRLQVELHEEQEKLAALKKDILTQNPASVTTIHESAIQTVPPEILSLIFTYFVEYQPTHIRRLLLVCRQWYSVIMNTPSLWTRIQIIADSTIDRNQLLSRSTYVRTCIERSRELLLDIVIDYGECRGIEDYYLDLIRDEVRELIKDMPADALLDGSRVHSEE